MRMSYAYFHFNRVSKCIMRLPQNSALPNVTQTIILLNNAIFFNENKIKTKTTFNFFNENEIRTKMKLSTGTK